jgi:hypothetical protein
MTRLIEQAQQQIARAAGFEINCPATHQAGNAINRESLQAAGDS